jgi:phage terminase small subunit
VNPKQQRFVEEYVVDLNATQAAIRAGYSSDTAYSQGQRLLKHVEVAQAIADGSQKTTTRLQLTAELVLNGLLDIALHGEREANRVRSWELLGKHLALFADRLEITQVPSSDLVKQWIDALEADLVPSDH